MSSIANSRWQVLYREGSWGGAGLTAGGVGASGGRSFGLVKMGLVKEFKISREGDECKRAPPPPQ